MQARRAMQAAGRLATGFSKSSNVLSTVPHIGSNIFTRSNTSRNAQAIRRTLQLGVVLTAAMSTAALGTCEAAAAASTRKGMRKDANGLWWKGDGETDGPYMLKSESSAPPLSASAPPSDDGDSDSDFKKIPFTVGEILPLAREIAISCNVAALSTVSEESPGQLFPR